MALKYLIAFSLISWQQPLSLIAPEGSTTPLMSSTVGLCPGGSVEGSWNEKLRFETGICLYLGLNNAGNRSGSTQAVVYQAQNIRSFGIHTHLSLWWSIGETAAVGMGAPIVLNLPEWPVPGSGYQLRSGQALQSGLFLSTKWHRDGWQVQPKFGMLSSQLYWNIEMGKAF